MRHAALATVAVLLAAALALFVLDDGSAPDGLDPGSVGARQPYGDGPFELAEPGESGGWGAALAAVAASERADASARASVTTSDDVDSAPTQGVRVRVVDDAGLGVAGATVLAHRGPRARGEAVARAVTDANGDAEIGDVPARFELLAEAEGYVLVESLRGTLESALEADDAVLVMQPAAFVEGVVVDASGAPVEGARATIGATSIMDRMTSSPGVFRAGHGDARATSDADGRFELGPVADRDHLLSVEARGFLRASVGVRPRTPVRVELDRGAGLIGTVFEADGTPAVGALVRSGSYATSERVFTDEQGRYAVHGYARPTGADARTEGDAGFAREALAPGAAATHGADGPASPPYLLVLHDGHAVEVVQPVHPAADPPAVQDVRLDPGHVIAGHVLDADGAPVPGAEVWIEGTNEVDAGYVTERRTTWESMAHIADTETEADGRFAFDRLYAGLWTVHASFPDDTRTVDVETRAGVDDLVVRLDRAVLDKVVLVGRVTDGLTGAPIPSFRIVPFVDGMGSHHDVDDPDGRFRVAGLPAGPVSITVSADGYASRDLGERSFALGEHPVDVRLLPTRELVLRVTEGGEEPNGSVQVHVLDRSGERLMVPTHESGTSNALFLHGGETGVRGLPAARVTVVATANDGREARAEVDLAPDVLHELTLDLEAETVEGPEPTTDVLTWIFALADGEDAAAFAASEVEPGQFRDELTPYVGRYVPLGGATIEFEDATGRNVATIAIEVVDAGGSESGATTLPTYRIETTFEGGTSTTEGAGAIANVDLVAGRYTVRVTAPGFATFERTLDLPAMDAGGYFLPLPLTAE